MEIRERSDQSGRIDLSKPPRRFNPLIAPLDDQINKPLQAEEAVRSELPVSEKRCVGEALLQQGKPVLDILLLLTSIGGALRW
jgi:hypothetical protein